MRTRFAVALLAASTLGACAEQPGAPVERDPNEGLLRDFLTNGKFDDAGHPLNSKVVDATAGAGTGSSNGAVTGCGGERDGGVQLRTGCSILLPAGANGTDLIANIRYRVRSAPASGRVVTFQAKEMGGRVLGKGELKVSNLRAYDRWLDLPVDLDGTEGQVRIDVDVANGAVVDLQYVEVFSNHLGIVIAPGSGVLADTDRITIELPKAKGIERMEANGEVIDERLKQLLDSGRATRTTTALRQLISVSVADLLPNREDVVELKAYSNGNTSRAQIRKTPAACNFEGDPNGTKVLITGFQPFPADGWHENVAAVAVTSLDASTLRGAQVMRLVLPVEYDRAAALPLDAIGAALEGIGEAPVRSTDPGRYICNNVMFNDIAQLEGRGRAGFIHLPYTTDFSDRTRWGRIAATAVQAVVDAP